MFYKDSLKEMREKLFEAMDPNNEYTMDDFSAEFNKERLEMREDLGLEAPKIRLSFINKSNNPDPEYATAGSSGFDLRANLGGDEAIEIPSGKVAIVPTGLYFEIPENFEIQVRPRSGLAAKHGVTVLNTPGTIDADYRGEVKVILINHSEEDFYVEHGDRIAQAVVATVTAKNIINLNRVDDIDENTERGAGGFGSTGTK